MNLNWNRNSVILTYVIISGMPCFLCPTLVNIASFLLLTCFTCLFTLQDYPSPGLIREILLESNVVPIFAVTSKEKPIYEVRTRPTVVLRAYMKKKKPRTSRPN